jgi:opacity protein-like surface antigen
MKTMKRLAGIAAVGVLAVQALPALAQEAGTQEVHAYAGALFGDDVTDRAISGRTPELDDDFTFGLRYAYNFTDLFGLEASVGHSPTSVKNVAGGDIDLGLTTLDLDAVYSFSNGTRFTPYVLAGVGYAAADLDRNIVGTVAGQPVSIADDEGFTLNAGFALSLPRQGAGSFRRFAQHRRNHARHWLQVLRTPLRFRRRSRLSLCEVHALAPHNREKLHGERA